jgi:hypothetical protein
VTIHLPLIVFQGAEVMGLQQQIAWRTGREMKRMDRIIGMIFDAMGSDDENDSQELVEYYNQAGSEQREAMNEMCIYLCGWSLETIFERCGLTIDHETGAVNV